MLLRLLQLERGSSPTLDKSFAGMRDSRSSCSRAWSTTAHMRYASTVARRFIAPPVCSPLFSAVTKKLLKKTRKTVFAVPITTSGGFPARGPFADSPRGEAHPEGGPRQCKNILTKPAVRGAPESLGRIRVRGGEAR